MKYFKTSFYFPTIINKNKSFNVNYVHPNFIPNKYISLFDSIYNIFTNKNTIELQDYLSNFRISNVITKFSIGNYNFGYYEIINKNKNYYNDDFLWILYQNFNVYYDNSDGIKRLRIFKVFDDELDIAIAINDINSDGDILCFSDDNSFIGCPIKAYKLIKQKYFEFENPFIQNKLIEYPIPWKICKKKEKYHTICYKLDNLLAFEYKKDIIELSIGDIIDEKHPCYFPNRIHDLYDYLSKFKDKLLFDFNYKNKISYNDFEIKIGLKNNIIGTKEDLKYCCELLHQREFLSNI